MKNLVLAGLAVLSMSACVTTPKPPRSCIVVMQEQAVETRQAGMIPVSVNATADGDFIAFMINTVTGEKDALLIKFATTNPPPPESYFKYQEDCTIEGSTGKVYRAKLRGGRVGLK